MELLKFLLECNVAVNVSDILGYTPLHLAAGGGHHEILELILPFSNIDSLNKYHSTPLSLAALWGHPSCVKVLLDKKADTKIRDLRGDDAAKCAAWAMHFMGIPDQKSECYRLITEVNPNPT